MALHIGWGNSWAYDKVRIPQNVYVMVNFCVYLIGLRDAQIPGKTFLSLCRIVPLEKLSIWIYSLSKEDHPYQCRWVSLRAYIEQKEGGRMNLVSVLEQRHLSSPVLGHWCPWFSSFQTQPEHSHHWTPDSQAFRLRLNYTTSFLILQLADGRV